MNELERAITTIKEIREMYPEDVFPDVSYTQFKSLNFTKKQRSYLSCTSAKMVRLTCDTILRKLEEKQNEQ